jgi:hypothetical protein
VAGNFIFCLEPKAILKFIFKCPVPNQFLHGSGLSKQWAINDVYGTDEGLLSMLTKPVVAMLLLFPINDKVQGFYNKTL